MERNEAPAVRGLEDRFFTATIFLFLALFLGGGVLLLLADVLYVNAPAVKTVFSDPNILHALWLSLWTSCATVVLSLLFALPMGYALSRYSFPGRILADTMVDLPIVFPPLVAGLTLLVFFSQTALGRWIENTGLTFVFQPRGIVLCQFLVSASYAIRTVKAAFDEIDPRLEKVALTLGASRWGAFFRVSLPLARNGVLAGGILTWARAFGIFGPLMIFVGSFRGRTEVLPTTVFLEQSIGHLEVALAVSLLLIAVAAAALLAVRILTGKALFR